MRETGTDSYRRAFIVGTWVLAIGLGLYLVPRDDGLRHVGLAFGEPRAWGEVYPFSQFDVFGDFDPWLGYDLCLRGLAAVADLLSVPRMAGQFAVLKLLGTGFIATLLLLCVRRSKILDALENEHALFLAFIVAAMLLAQPLLRVSLIRPFAFGSFLLIYCVGKTGAAKGFVSSALLFFFYPYLAWMYTGPVVVAHFLRGSRSFALGSFVATLAGIAVQPRSFWGLLVELVRSDAVRDELNTGITEFAPIVEHFAVVIIAVIAALIFIPLLSKQARKLRTEHIIMLLFLPVSIKYIRYFLDVQLGLLFVAHGADIVRILHGPSLELRQRWRSILKGAKEPETSPGSTGEDADPGGRTVLRVVLVVGYGLFALALGFCVFSQHKRLEQMSRFLADVPQSDRLLTEFNLQYRILYARPDLSLIPSSEIGFPRADIKKSYIDFLNNGRVCGLARITHANFLIESRSLYLDPQDVSCLEIIKENEKSRLWRIDF